LVESRPPKPPQQPPRPPPKRIVNDNDALLVVKPAMRQCLVDHQEGGLYKEEIAATITILASGRAKHVQLKPDVVNGAPLGACLRNELMAAPYPTRPEEMTFTVMLTPKT
jgi:hypothetical protein